MHRWVIVLLAVAVCAAVAAAPGMVSAGADPVIPMAGGPDVSGATTITSLPATDAGQLVGGSGTSVQDAVWAIDLAEGERFYAEVTYSTGATGAAASLFLYRPGIASVKDLPLEDDIVAEAAYQGVGSPSPLRLAYTVPSGKAGTYYVDLMCEWGIVNYMLRAKNGPAECSLAASRNVLGWYAGSASYATVTGKVDSNLTPYPYDGTEVEVWAHWRGLDRDGVDRMERLGTTTLRRDGTWSFYPVTPSSTKMPWTSTLRIEWPGKNDMATDDKGWVKEGTAIEVYPYASARPSRWIVNRRQLLYIKGRVYPPEARDAGISKPKISLYVSRPGARGLRIVRHYWLPATGYFRFLQRPSIKGTWYYKVRYLPAVFSDKSQGVYYQRYRRSYSRTIPIKVR